MNKFDKVFTKYAQPDWARKILDNVENVTYRIDRERRIVEINAKFVEVVKKDKLYAIEDDIRAAYDLRIVRILPKYTADKFDPRYIPEVMRELNRIGAVSRGFFNEYDYEFVGSRLNIQVSFTNGGVELLY